MTTIEGETLLTRDKSSGRVHGRIRVPGQTVLRTFESCNLDTAGEYEVIGSVEDVEPDALCRRCFPMERDPFEGTPV